uniref:Sex-determining region Y protein n=1 Tax=Leucosolenia complicata TaxID=433461 RepID=I7DEG0_9METZ|nr:SoxF2 [Leucosolenia complicata]
MSSAIPMLPNGVERLETLSSLCALEIANHGMLDTKRSLLLEEGLLAAGVSANGQSGLMSNGGTLREEPAIDPNQPMCDMLIDSADQNQRLFGNNITNEDTQGLPLVRSKKLVDQASRIKRPMNPFMIWAKGERSTILTQNPTMHNSDVSRQLGRNWRGMSLEEKRPYILAAEHLAEEHRRLHPNYKYRPRKKDPNVQRVRGRRLDSEALNRVAKALTKQEISACVSGNGASFLRKAARPSSVSLSSQPRPHKFDPYQPRNRPSLLPAAAANHSDQHSPIKMEYITASAPVTPVREEPMMSSHQRRLSHPNPPPLNTGYDRSDPRERGWYSCPPSPTSSSSQAYSKVHSETILECRKEQLEATSSRLMESREAEELRTPPPLMDSTRYQSSHMHTCPPPPLMNVSSRVQNGVMQQMNSSPAASAPAPPPPTLPYPQYSPSPQPQQLRGNDSPAGMVLQHSQMDQSRQHLNYQSEPTVNHPYQSQRHISPPLDQGTTTPAEDSPGYHQPALHRNSYHTEHQPPRDNDSPSQISTLATKILTIMVKRGDDESVSDDVASTYRASSTSPGIKYETSYDTPAYTIQSTNSYQPHQQQQQQQQHQQQPFYQNCSGRPAISSQPPLPAPHQPPAPVVQGQLPTVHGTHLQRWPAPVSPQQSNSLYRY